VSRIRFSTRTARRFALALPLLVGNACERTESVSPEPATSPTAASEPAAVTDESGDDEDHWVERGFTKTEARVPMRDGATLYTTIYAPRRTSADDTRRFPILLKRTPYSLEPYGADAFASSIGPNRALAESGYIVVYQDVRGTFMSDGEFVNMRPHIDEKRGPADVDESTDTWDTVAWLIENVSHNNGRVGMWGVSYPGFYAAAGMIDHHPALIAVSPQAPIADWWYDDFHHHGAFFLPHAFNFLARFGIPREGLRQSWPPRFDHGTPDGYAFFRELGPLENANKRYFHDEIPFWNEIVSHPNRDEFWSSRDILPHLHDVSPAVMTVGGWFDAEDLYGPLQIYREVERQNPDVFNVLVMGPWRHGGWSRTQGRHLGDVDFGSATSAHYQEQIERRFFDHFLKGDGEHGLAEANVFETGANQWRRFDAWPPNGVRSRTIYFGPAGSLSEVAPAKGPSADSFVSDPAHPVPFTTDIAIGMTREYMTDDQRFAARRPDVLTYVTERLDEPLTIAGPIDAKLVVSTTADDADWIVKLIDVFPSDTPTPEGARRGTAMGGYQMMVRSEVLRGRFRDSPAQPARFPRGKAVELTVPLQDVLHTFAPGHRLMVQVQSTWFPLVDVNPQGWVDNIFEAEASDFVEATHRVYRDAKRASRIEFAMLPAGG
jgi:putative CocE/NonD family hydrolase